MLKSSIHLLGFLAILAFHGGWTAPQNNAQAETLSKTNLCGVPPKFEAIGSSFFYFEHDLKQNWTAAAETCRQMGGHLAVIRDEQQFNAIYWQLQHNKWYWLGIKKGGQEDQFVSVTSGTPAPFLKWGWGHPNPFAHDWDCVQVITTVMINARCTNRANFICQWSNEI
ncbi:accessory gland protein Acp29AB-like [Drosophila biarmipes]|uniref:accessory gland protein Acp29AB-like n=1 Tax=Drosophila biarmipes TaxID=125945 RepID=UPI0007E73EED|nr:accessory gland protein Acp29AB-like [Drosophila biarmipes]